MKKKVQKKTPLEKNLELLDKIADDFTDWQFDDVTLIQGFMYREASYLIRLAIRMVGVLDEPG